MRDVGIDVLRAVGVDTGGCNIQFAVHPETGRLVVIEMNPRVSRSSRAGVEGHRLPDRQDRRAAGRRLHARRDPQRHHRRDPGRVRADAGLRRGEGAAVRVREVPRRRPRADHDDEERRRGDGAGPHRSPRRWARRCARWRRRRPASGPRRTRGATSTPLTTAARRTDGRIYARRAGAAARARPSPRCARRPASTRGSSTRSTRWCALRARDRRRAGARRAAAAAGQARRALRPAAGRAAPGARRRGRRAHAAAPAGRPAGLQDRRHLRRRVRRAHAVPLHAPTRPTPRPSRRSRRRPSGRRC